MNQYQKAMQSHFVAQWITSLAISVICCAVLFVVFAGYIVQLHDKANLTEIRLEVLKERQEQLVNELATLKRMPMVQFNGATMQQLPQATMQPTDAPVPAPEGVNISERPADEAGKAATDEVKATAQPMPAPASAMETNVGTVPPAAPAGSSINLPPVEPKKTLPLVR